MVISSSFSLLYLFFCTSLFQVSNLFHIFFPYNDFGDVPSAGTNESLMAEAINDSDLEFPALAKDKT